MSLSNYSDQFINRHSSHSEEDLEKMFKTIGISSIEELIDQTIPKEIRLKEELNLPKAISEYDYLKRIKALAGKNEVFNSYIGMGYYNTITPTVILRNILENPAWYTAYTPYQAEIAQGRLEALINFQTIVTELTGMEIANASLLDEATAAAEAMAMLFNARKGKKKNANKFFISENCHPQTIAVLETRANPIGIEIEIGSEEEITFTDESLFGETFFGAILQYPDTNGAVKDHEQLITTAHEHDVNVILATDLLALTLLESPGKLGADVVVGTSQRFGVPMGYGGPHAGFFATKDKFKRQIPGRIIGASLDNNGDMAYRMALQTREQHIRREKATSNICTSQVLLAVIASFYAVYHGPQGLIAIAKRVNDYTKALEATLKSLGIKQVNASYFDTLKFEFQDIDVLKSIAENEKINFRYYKDGFVSIAIDETINEEALEKIIYTFKKAINKSSQAVAITTSEESSIPSNLVRSDLFLQQKAFSDYHTEHGILRYMKSLESKDLSMVHSMISLGSCTMKLNATSEMIPVTLPEFGAIHPFAPIDQTKGYAELFKRLNQWLSEITGFSAMSFQPNSGAQGEYAGLMVIRAYHEDRNEAHRNIALIPSSAHGTNPASAVMAGMKVIVVACDENGNIDIKDLKEKAIEHKDSLSCLMVTYPSTHGVFERGINDICDTIHQNGGLVYMDGANMNAQVGLTSPANIGADVCHLNLHKTFAIPHGGGGPGMGPIGVVEKLVPYLPGHNVIQVNEVADKNITAVSAAPWGSASILPISYGYMMMLGGEGLKKSTEHAIFNANYILNRLKEHYPILYTGENGRCAHEMIVDFRAFKQSVGIEVEDIAKRLMDYGFHAPTVSFPVAGTLMIEPTESETLAELDRFCDALINIRKEIAAIENGDADKENNVLVNAPHTMSTVITSNWDRPYSVEEAAFPLDWVKANKFWPSVGRINSAQGDRNLICTCPSIEEYT